MNAVLRRKLTFIEKYLTPATKYSAEDILSPYEAARLMREAATLIEMDQTGDAAEVTGMLAKHHEAVHAARLSGNAPVAMAVTVADRAALGAAAMDDGDGIEY